MAIHNDIERPSQGLNIECALQPPGVWLIIRDAARFDLVQKPQSLLSKGKQRGAARCPARDTLFNRKNLAFFIESQL